MDYPRKFVADCLQTHPIDSRYRVVKIRGGLEAELIDQIDKALKIIFDLVGRILIV